MCDPPADTNRTTLGLSLLLTPFEHMYERFQLCYPSNDDVFVDEFGTKAMPVTTDE